MYLVRRPKSAIVLSLVDGMVELHYVFYVQQLGHVKVYMKHQAGMTVYFIVNCTEEATSRLRSSFYNRPHLAARLFFVDAVVADEFLKSLHIESEETRTSLRDYVLSTTLPTKALYPNSLLGKS